MVVSFSVAYFVPFPSYLEVLVGLCLVILVLTCLVEGILGGISVLMASPPDHWNPVFINALKLYVGFWGILKVQLWSFLDGSLKLRYCTTFLPHVCPLGLYPSLAMGVVNVSLVFLAIILIQVVIWGNGSGLPRRHVQEQLLMSL